MNATILLAATLFLAQAPAESAAAEDRVEAAKALVAQLNKGEFETVVAAFDATMTRVLPAEKVKQVWDGLISQFGELKQTAETRTEEADPYRIVIVTTVFEKSTLETKVVFDADGKVAGLFFAPAGKYEPPDYADPAKFDEIELTVGQGWWKLPGTLSLPKGEGPFAAVVLVHGSGPQDRDETIGPNKPLRDLAHGLASRGIAVLRYEKRTKHHQLSLVILGGNLTVKEEAVDDAAAAVETLAAREKIDPQRIFVAGHSMGGYLIPRIAKANERVAGLVSLAGSARSLQALIREQTAYLAGLDGQVTEEEQEHANDVEKQLAAIEALTADGNAHPFGGLLGAPAAYWLDLRDYEPAKEAADINKPMLFLQGGRDFQVTEKDFSLWRKALEGRPDVTFIRYPKLNHLFMAGEGQSSLTEYHTPSHVAEEVIEDIANWISGPE